MHATGIWDAESTEARFLKSDHCSYGRCHWKWSWHHWCRSTAPGVQRLRRNSPGRHCQLYEASQVQRSRHVRISLTHGRRLWLSINVKTPNNKEGTIRVHTMTPCQFVTALWMVLAAAKCLLKFSSIRGRRQDFSFGAIAQTPGNFVPQWDQGRSPREILGTTD